MLDSLIEGEVDFDDDTSFRIDTYDGVDNTAMYLGYSSINAFHSVVPSSIMEFYEYIDVERSVGSRPETDYYALRPLLSVKYLLNRMDGDSFIDHDTKQTQMEGYTYIDSQSGYYVYLNDNYVPYGFSYDYYMTEEFCDSYSGVDKANLMLKALLLTDEQIEKYGHLFTDIENLDDDSEDGQAGRTLYFDYDSYVYDCARLRETSATSFETDNYGFTATVTRDKESLVFFSIPFDEGWSATVNGKQCQIEKVNKGFMAVLVPEGETEIRFNYQTPGLKTGLFITGVTAIVLLLYMFIFIKFCSRHSGEESYPEGDILIESWMDQEKKEAKQQVKDSEIQSLLDRIYDIQIPREQGGFDGGFKIEQSDSEENNTPN